MEYLVVECLDCGNVMEKSPEAVADWAALKCSHCHNKSTLELLRDDDGTLHTRADPDTVTPPNAE